MITRLSVLFAAIAIVSAQATPAHAKGPDQFQIEFDVTRLQRGLTSACGFDVFRHSVGDFHVTLFSDEDGEPRREIDAGRATITWFSPSRGTSATVRSLGPTITDYNGEGEGVTVGLGAGLRLHVPGDEPLYFNAGRQVFDAVVVGETPEGIPITVVVGEPEQDGHFTGGSLISAICSALT